jgi:hypothetical protein
MKLYRFSLVALVACSDTTTNAPTQLNLDRPVDVAFACHGGLRITGGNAPDPSQPIVSSAQPIDSCVYRSGKRATGQPAPQPPGQENLGAASNPGGAFWYAFILQSGPGTVAVAQFATKPATSFTGNNDVLVLDSNPLTPGKNSISVGEDPIAIATDKVGCYEVIANAGSCDMSTLEVNSAVVAALGESSDTVEPLVKRMDIKNAAGQVMRARPTAMVFEPAGGTIGMACPATATGLAYVAYPSCHIVAGVDVSTGTIVTAIQFDAAGVPTVVGGNVTCPADCDGAAPTPGIRPVALDLEKDPRTGRTLLAIGADNSRVLSVYDLDAQTSLPLSLTQVPLVDTTGRLGLTSVAITPLIGMGGTNGVVLDDLAPGNDHQFVYAVATDGTVRVADLTGSPKECDTQIDPRYIRDLRDVDRLACMPATVADQTCTMDAQCPTNFCGSNGKCAQFPRRPGVRGPGIELVGDSVPTSVDIVRVEPVEMDNRPAGHPTKMIGYFGLISAADGRLYSVQVDNDDVVDWPGQESQRWLESQVPLVAPHQLKDSVPSRGLVAEQGDPAKLVCGDDGPDPDAQGGNSGGPRLAGSLQRSLPAGVVAAEKVGGLPSIRQVLCHDEVENLDRPVSELFFSAPEAVREEVFPDLRALRNDETWSVTYEGSLSIDKADTAVDGPAVRMSQVMIDGAGMHLVDASRPYCDAGVEQFDVVQMRGCDPALGDAGCPIGYTCYVHPQSQVVGIGACMLAEEAERLSNTCKSFLTSLRRYTVGTASNGELRLVPRKSVLRTTPINGCDTDVQCEVLADYAIQNSSAANPGDPGLPTDPKTWRCLADNDRRPTTTGKRCLNVCETDADCGFGTVCQGHPGAAPQSGFCMEGVVPPQACVNAPQRYELRAGDAFAVVGTRQGYIHPIISNSGDACVRDTTANPLQTGRIPLDAPACDPMADPRTGRKPDGTYDANPCKLTVDETEIQANFVPGTCELGDPERFVTTRQATAIRFRNRSMQLTIVDPTYNGDLMCHGDRMGTLTNVPLVMPGYQLAFRQTAGFTPLIVAGIAPALPIKVLRGPLNSYWVVDEGDFLSSSISQASTRGKVYRIESHALNIINLLE